MDLRGLEIAASTCQLCNLCDGRIKPVFARGNPKAELVVCGMCAGPDENRAGIPFVGPAGQLLDAVLSDAFPQHVNFSDYVYITNLVKCFVAPGKKLENVWMNSCLPYFLIQLNLIRPKVVVALGKDVCNYLLNVDQSIGSLRGKVYDYMGNVKLLCTYHTAYLTRGGGVRHPDYKKVVKDFEKAVNML